MHQISERPCLYAGLVLCWHKALYVGRYIIDWWVLYSTFPVHVGSTFVEITSGFSTTYPCTTLRVRGATCPLPFQ